MVEGGSSNTEEGAATLVKEQQHNKRSGSIEGGMATLRSSGNIKEEWQHQGGVATSKEKER